MTEGEKQGLALAAAHQASEAAGELIRYAREGAWHSGSFCPDVEPIEKLLDAAKLAMEVQGGPDLDGLDSEQVQVYAAICNFLEGWA